jgi:hypothetical protein
MSAEGVMKWVASLLCDLQPQQHPSYIPAGSSKAHLEASIDESALFWSSELDGL